MSSHDAQRHRPDSVSVPAEPRAPQENEGETTLQCGMEVPGYQFDLTALRSAPRWTPSLCSHKARGKWSRVSQEAERKMCKSPPTSMAIGTHCRPESRPV